MFCKKCGAYNDDNSKICALCGNSFADEENLNIEVNNDFTNEEFNHIPNPPKSYFIRSVILSILGSVPFGVTAVVLSVLADVNYEAENFDMAERYSKKSRFFCLTSLIIGIIKWLSALFWYFMIK